jgi:hypothetical protein
MALPRVVRRLGTILVALVVAYAAFLTAMFVVMRQPPDRFGRIMARMPTPAFMILPFERLWSVARAGRLEVGDTAPDFTLRTIDRQSQVQLSAFRGRQPVALVFGSYT